MFDADSLSTANFAMTVNQFLRASLFLCQIGTKEKIESALLTAALQHQVSSCFSNGFLATCLSTEIPSTLTAALAPVGEEAMMWRFCIKVFPT